jgi:hypothetical protein
LGLAAAFQPTKKSIKADFSPRSGNACYRPKILRVRGPKMIGLALCRKPQAHPCRGTGRGTTVGATICCRPRALRVPHKRRCEEMGVRFGNASVLWRIDRRDVGRRSRALSWCATLSIARPVCTRNGFDWSTERRPRLLRPSARHGRGFNPAHSWATLSTTKERSA